MDLFGEVTKYEARIDDPVGIGRITITLIDGQELVVPYQGIAPLLGTLMTVTVEEQDRRAPWRG